MRRRPRCPRPGHPRRGLRGPPAGPLWPRSRRAADHQARAAHRRGGAPRGGGVHGLPLERDAMAVVHERGARLAARRQRRQGRAQPHEPVALGPAAARPGGGRAGDRRRRHAAHPVQADPRRLAPQRRPAPHSDRGLSRALRRRSSTRGRWRLSPVRALCRAVAVVLAVTAAGCGLAASGPPDPTTPIVRAGPRSARSHVIVVVMENKEQGRVLGSHDAPFLARLAERGGVAANSYGVRHPSLPNYIALVSGSTQGITDDCTGCSANGRNVADQLEAAHRTWGAYLEGLPRPCARPAFAGRYAKKHDPFAYDDKIAASPARCRRRVPLRRLADDIRGDRLPDFSFIAPDLCNDTHDCSVRTGDRFLSRVVPAVLSALGPHGFVVVTYDEGDSDRGCCGGSHGGRIATVVAGPDVRRGTRMTQPIDHYGVLASIEDAFGLPPRR